MLGINSEPLSTSKSRMLLENIEKMGIANCYRVTAMVDSPSRLGRANEMSKVHYCVLRVGM